MPASECWREKLCGCGFRETGDARSDPFPVDGEAQRLAGLSVREDQPGSLEEHTRSLPTICRKAGCVSSPRLSLPRFSLRHGLGDLVIGAVVEKNLEQTLDLLFRDVLHDKHQPAVAVSDGQPSR